MTHPWGTWHNMVQTGRMRKKRTRPRREQLLVEAALHTLGLRYRTWVPVLNPHWHGWKEDRERAMQWLDFCIWSGRGMFVLLFRARRGQSGVKAHEKRAHAAKKRFLTEKNIPWLEIGRDQTSQIYASIITSLIRREAL